MRILLYGAPGAGKTTAGRLLHRSTEIELYEGDYLREVKLPEEVGESDDPFLYIGTKQAWRHFGELNQENVTKGLLAVRDSMRLYIEEELSGYKDIIFEAAFLDPSTVQGDKLCLIITQDESNHSEQFFREKKYFHPKYGARELDEGFEASRLIQDYLIEEAHRIGVPVIENSGDEQALLRQLKTGCDLPT